MQIPLRPDQRGNAVGFDAWPLVGFCDGIDRKYRSRLKACQRPRNGLYIIRCGRCLDAVKIRAYKSLTASKLEIFFRKSENFSCAYRKKPYLCSQIQYEKR